MTDFATEFKQRFDREPTREDLREVTSRLPLEGGSDKHEDFNRALEDMRVAGNLTTEDVTDIISKMATETKEAKARRADDERQRNATSKARWNRFFLCLFAGAVLGMACCVFFTLHNGDVARAIKAYEDKRAGLDALYADKERALQEKFFGPLGALTDVQSTTLSPLERDLCVPAYLGTDIGGIINGKSDVICDKVVGGTRVVGKLCSINHDPGNRYSTTAYYLVVEKRLPSDGSLLSAFVYDVTSTKPDEAVASTKPNVAIEFSGATAKVLNFSAKSYTQIEGARVVFHSGGGDNFGPYEKLGADVASQFRDLFGRGPNQAEK